MKKKLITYGILIVLGYLFLKPIIPIGDYCAGLLGALNFFFIGVLLIITLLILTIINIIGIRKNKIRFDFIPLAIVIILGVTYFSILEQDDRKFWTKTIVSGWIEIESTPKSGSLKLFKNGTFAATLHSADYSCTFQGDYELTGVNLNLKRADLSELTEDVFTTEYILDKNTQTLNPVGKKFGIIEIRK